MVYAIQAQLAFRNQARRDAVSGNIATYVASKTTFGPVYRTDYTSIAGDSSVALEVRFTTRAEQDQAWTDIQAQVGTGINGPITGSTIYRHDCPQTDGEAAPCVVAERRDF